MMRALGGAATRSRPSRLQLEAHRDLHVVAGGWSWDSALVKVRFTIPFMGSPRWRFARLLDIDVGSGFNASRMDR